ncbi:MAG: hypothetical protein ABIS18_02405 [Actinomycetota bacterium]
MKLPGLFVMALLVIAAPAQAGHQVGHGLTNGAPANAFASDFTPPQDEERAWPLGGFGGESAGKQLTYNPVIFIHGNGSDATFWDVGAEVSPTTLKVRRVFREAGYADQEIWAVSYNGAGCSNTTTCGTANDINTTDIFRFIESVRNYTLSEKVDIVAHSLGVTIVRKAIKQHPELLQQIEDMVLIAGANHGTTACKGFETIYYGCDEIAPGTPWLADLNAWNPKGEGDETPGPIRYMTVYDGSGTSDNFFLTDEAQSPALSGAFDNHQLPGELHLALARGQKALDVYLPFLKSNNVLARLLRAPLINVDTGRAGTKKPLASTGSFDYRWGILLIALAAALAIFNDALSRGERT